MTHNSRIASGGWNFPSWKHGVCTSLQTLIRESSGSSAYWNLLRNPIAYYYHGMVYQLWVDHRLQPMITVYLLQYIVLIPNNGNKGTEIGIPQTTERFNCNSICNCHCKNGRISLGLNIPPPRNLEHICWCKIHIWDEEVSPISDRGPDSQGTDTIVIVLAWYRWMRQINSVQQTQIDRYSECRYHCVRYGAEVLPIEHLESILLQRHIWYQCVICSE